MKYFTAIMLGIAFMYSCGTTQKVSSNDQEETTTYPVINTPVTDTNNTSEETPRVTYSTGSKINPSEEKEEIEEITEEEIEVTETIQVVAPTEAFDHSAWNDLLNRFVTAKGNVDYKAFKGNRSTLRNYIATLGEKMPDATWSQENTLAYWMNAYNAMTVDLIVRNYPLKSIKDIKDPWKQRLWKLGEKWYNLDEIEHQILRKMDEPRIHFGINCASYSCPPLLNEAFTAANVDQKLEQLAIDFINDPTRNSIASERVRISKIFNWFGKDFKKQGSLIDYLNNYSEIKISENARKSYMDYNWDLNE